MSDPLLSIEDLTVTFTNQQVTTNAVENINFTVNRGELVAIVGESGSGKSVTSLSILQLLSTPPASYPSGRLMYAGNDGPPINLLSESETAMQKIRGNQVSMIFQEPMTSLNPVYTCGNQVMEAIVLHQKISNTEARQKTLALFAKVELPDPAAMFKRYPHELSGGQKQRVMIAMAISCDPLLLLCDEPTTALDVTVQKTILDLIKSLQVNQRMGVIFITHDLGVVAEIADRVVVMYKGKIVEQGLAADIYLRPAHPYTKALLACRPALQPKLQRLPVVSDFMLIDSNGNISAKPKQESSTAKLEAAGFSAAPAKPAIQTGERKALLQVNNLKAWFPVKTSFLRQEKQFIKAVDDVSFNVYEGETLGLVGESGCGKSTLGRCILRLIKATAGSVIFDDEEVFKADKETLRKLRQNMQIIFQDPYSSLNPRMTIGNAIAEPFLVHGILKKPNDRKEKVIELLQKVGLKGEHFNRYPHEFSGGQRQRIVIARALALEPRFVVCDESVSALDVSVQAQVLNLLNDLKTEFGFTAIFISHDLSVVRYISDRIMVMKDGRIVETGAADDVYHHPQLPYTQKLISSIPKGLLTS